MRVRSTQAVKRETTRKTGNGTEKTFEGLGHVMGKKVFVYLHDASANVV
jgi:hypothetical protein